MTTRRSILIVDAGYLFNAPRFRVDALKLRRLIDDHAGQGGIREAYWYDSVPNPVPEGQIKFHHFLKSAPPYGPQFRLSLYQLKTMPVHCSACGGNGDRTVQKGVDVGIATLIVKAAALQLCEHIHLVAGDGDFRDAIAFVQESRRMDVSIYGFQGSVSTDLQSWATHMVWLDTYVRQLARDDAGDGYVAPTGSPDGSGSSLISQ